MARLGRVLVVDDEAIARKDLAATLSEHGYEVETAADAFKALGKVAAFAPHVVVTDLKMPGMTGIELTHKLRALEPAPAVIVMSGFRDVDSAIEAIRIGVVEYVGKPLDITRLATVLARTIEHQRLVFSTRAAPQRVTDPNLAGDSAAMQRVFAAIDLCAASPSPVLITGESGTGKRTVARAIHQRSERVGLFLEVRCTGCSESSLASQLFGDERGEGVVRRADGGTLFLSDVAAIPDAIQGKLLRLLQEKRFERIGADGSTHVDVRVIAGTTHDLDEAVRAHRFRADLYFRLGALSLALPALRDRIVDIPILATHFLGRHATSRSWSFDGLSEAAIARLCNHDWPGNVRELENVIARGAERATGPVFDARHLPEALQQETGRRMPRIPGATLAELTKYAILETLEATGGSTARAAEILGISARTIQYKLHEYSTRPRRRDVADEPS